MACSRATPKSTVPLVILPADLRGRFLSTLARLRSVLRSQALPPLRRPAGGFHVGRGSSGACSPAPGSVLAKAVCSVGPLAGSVVQTGTATFEAHRVCSPPRHRRPSAGPAAVPRPPRVLTSPSRAAEGTATLYGSHGRPRLGGYAGIAGSTLTLRTRYLSLYHPMPPLYHPQSRRVSGAVCGAGGGRTWRPAAG